MKNSLSTSGLLLRPRIPCNHHNKMGAEDGERIAYLVGQNLIFRNRAVVDFATSRLADDEVVFVR